MRQRARTGSWGDIPVIAVAILLCCGGCSSSGPAGDAAAPADGAPSDGGADLPASDSGADAADAAPKPDGPKPPARWEEVGGTVIPQVEDQVATLLADGRVLIIGGLKRDPAEPNTKTPQSAAYLYDPAANQFVEIPMAQPRVGHTATLLDDGRVLVVGGWAAAAGSSHNTTELFTPSPAGGRWSAGPDMPQAVYYHATTRLQDGNLLLTGGNGTPSSSDRIWRFEVKQGQWKILGGFLNERRRLHTATLLKDGKVLLAGGTRRLSPGVYGQIDSLELFDPKAGTVRLASTKMSMGRVGHRALRLADGRVFIAGGHCSAECATNTGASQKHDIYDPVTDVVLQVAHPGQFPTSSHAATVLKDGRVLVLGFDYTPTKAAAYDPDDATWTSPPDLPTAQSRVSAVTLHDGSVLVAGGLNDVEAFTHADKAYRLYHP